MKITNVKILRINQFESFFLHLGHSNEKKKMSSVPNTFEIHNLRAIRLKRFAQKSFDRTSFTEGSLSLSFSSTKRNNRFSYNNGANKLSRTFSDSILNKTCLNANKNVIFNLFFL